MTDIRFGTDGWRAEIADAYTFDNVRKVAQAVADYVNAKEKATGKRRLIVGYDCRFMSDEYAKAVAEVLAANRIKVYLTDRPTPTPAISFTIKKKRLNGALIITASHNPFNFNGIKFKTELAAPADSSVTAQIEKMVGRTKPKALDYDCALSNGKIELFDAGKEYVRFIRSYIDIKAIAKRRPRILVDYMHGAGYGYIEEILKGTHCRIEAIRSKQDPLFGGVNPEPIPKNLQASRKHIMTKTFDLGIALDGDADRIGAIRPDGRYITSGEIISLILLHFLEDRHIYGTVVKTISGTTLIERICERFELKMYEVPVGFKYIARLMQKENILIGGEESGGIGFCGYIPERDGILSGLLLINMLAERRSSIISIMDKIDKQYGRFCYDRLDIRYPQSKAKALTHRLKTRPPERIAGKRVVRIKAYDGIKFIREDSSWLLLRFSGTEPLIRIYAEAGSDRAVKRLLEAGKRIIGT
ncbi:MAG: phosphoglucomutase/phosphomannomutase family protein [Candidatus Omnitrophica bacterium]|nr:phosphoglucomutase/phosphomannomutase family protein [Candidatus Omnitrophota bacterium]